MSQLASIPPKYSPCEELSPLELVQSLLSGRLAAGAHVIVTSRPHTLTYLQVTGTNNTLQCTVGEIRVFCPMGVLGVFI